MIHPGMTHVAQATMSPVGLSPATNVSEKKAATRRMLGIDFVRVLASLAVVWNHVAQTLAPETRSLRYLGRFSVPFFIAVGVLFLYRAVAGAPADNPLLPLKTRAVRVLRPWAVWSALYLGLEFLKAAIGGKQFHLPPHLLLQGATREYWFLPFILISSVLLFPILRLAAKKPSAQVVIIVLGFASSLLIYSGVFRPLDWFFQEGWLPDRWQRDLGIVPSAAALGLLLEKEPALQRDPRVLLFGVVGFLAGLTLLLTMPHFSPGGHLAGVSAALVGVSLPATRLVKRVAPLGKHTYFIYLSHVIAIWPVYSLAKRFGPFSVPTALGFTLLLFLSCLAASILARKVRPLRFLVP